MELFYIPSFSAEPMWYAGLIWALVMALAASSYASNFSYRIPRGEQPFGREPYCGDCNHKLTTADLFPIFSYLFSAGKCRYCSAKLPSSYFWLELFYTLYGGLCYIAYGFGDMFIILAFSGMLLQISFMMAADDDHLSNLLSTLILSSGIIFQLLLLEMLLDALLGVFFGLIGGILLSILIRRKMPTKDIHELPKWVWLLAASGAWLDFHSGVIFIATGLLLLLCAKAINGKKSTDSLIAMVQAPSLLIAIWFGTLGGF